MPDKHIERLRGVFEKLSAAGLRLKPSKCEFFKSQIAYLGHIVFKDGIQTKRRQPPFRNGRFQKQLMKYVAFWDLQITIINSYPNMLRLHDLSIN